MDKHHKTLCRTTLWAIVMTDYTDVDGVSDAYRDWLNGLSESSTSFDIFYDARLSSWYCNKDLSVRTNKGLRHLCEKQGLDFITANMFRDGKLLEQLACQRNVGSSTIKEVVTLLERKYGINVDAEEVMKWV